MESVCEGTINYRRLEIVASASFFMVSAVAQIMPGGYK
jgi:hypothetical protein